MFKEMPTGGRFHSSIWLVVTAVEINCLWMQLGCVMHQDVSIMTDHSLQFFWALQTLNSFVLIS